MVNDAQVKAPPFLPPNDQIRKDLDSQQVRIQVALFITFIIFALVLGRLRSRGSNLMKLISTKSFMITAYLVSFIPGLMSSGTLSSDIYVFWIAFMAYLAAVANELSCYTLSDNEDRKRRLIIDYGFIWPLIFSFLRKSLASPEIMVPIVIIFWVVVLKLRERSHALSYATKTSNGLSRSTKIVSDFNIIYKKDEYQINNNIIDNNTMYPSPAFLNNNSSYNNLLVGVKEARSLGSRLLMDFDLSKVVTLDKVLESNEPFLVSSNEGKELQNTCISFGMFWLLLTKIAGYEDVDAKIFKSGNKLPDNSFALIETELGFFYDYLFTNYYAIYDRGLWKKLRDLCVISLFFLLSLPLLVEYRSQDQNILYLFFLGGVLDNRFTRFVILAIITIEFTQLGIFLTSKWAKIMYTCSYLKSKTQRGTRSSILERLIKIACHVPRPRLRILCFNTFTKRRISQYSILKCYCEIPRSIWFKSCLGSYFDLPRMGQAGNWKTNLPLELQQSILSTIDVGLGQREGKFTNGVYSLRVNGVEEDIVSTYVKKVKSQARAILIWHIATSLIEDDTKLTSPSTCYDNDFQAATIISNYSAYLVAFAPQMLPNHGYATECVFDEIVKELEQDMKEDAKDHEDPKKGLNDENSILKEAQQLKEKLQQQPNVWKTLAEFWIERLLFLALADHGDAIEAHANGLCVGGEFITLLWALLTHAGCSRTPIQF